MKKEILLWIKNIFFHISRLRKCYFLGTEEKQRNSQTFLRNEWQFFQRNKQLFPFLEKKVHFWVKPSYFFFLWQKEIEIFYQEERSAGFSDHVFSILFFHCVKHSGKIFTVSLNSKKFPWKCFLTTSNMKKTKTLERKKILSMRKKQKCFFFSCKKKT